MVQRMHDAGLPRPRYLHASNTGGVLRGPAAHFDLVRVGVGLFGIAPGPDLAPRTAELLRPALTWRSRVTMTKRLPAGERLSYGRRYRLDTASTVATVPVGYADGYSRLLEGKASVLVGGRRVPVAGSVTMDQILVDCGDLPVQAGDEVVLLGPQGGERIAVDEVAAWMGTIGYEVVCRIGERVPRHHMGVEEA
jgi:alanine racemase